MKKLHIPEFLIPLSLSSYGQNVLIKTQKPQLCCCPDGLMVKLSVYQAVPTACAGSNPVCGNFFLFPKLFSLQVNARKSRYMF